MMTTGNSKKSDLGNKLILPHQPYHDEFLQTMTKIFHWSRWVGLVGLEKFVWKLWGFLLLSLFIAIECQAVWKVLKAIIGWAADIAGHRSVAARLAGTMFYAASILGLLQGWRLSSSWKELSQYWASVEWALSIQYVSPDTNLKGRMYTISSIVAVCTIFEHALSTLCLVDFHCQPSSCLRKYILRSHGFLLLNHEYSDWIAVPLLFMSIVATILWNLQDLIIILISMGLTSRYRRLNDCVAKVAARNKEETKFCKDTEFLKIYLWRKIREAYVKQSMLVQRVDRSIGGIVLLSTFFNFYFICLQLFLGITQDTMSILKKVYYVISMIWLSIRTAYTVLAAADVNKYSTMALPYLYQCNAQSFNTEIERLQKQLVKDYVALSGMGIFSLTRMVVLKMCGAVVTYVLVLIQYDDRDQ